MTLTCLDRGHGFNMPFYPRQAMGSTCLPDLDRGHVELNVTL